MMNFLKGKKTYIIVGIFLILAIITFTPSISIPIWVFTILGALGLAAYRTGIADISGNKGWRSYTSAVLVAAFSVLQALKINLPFETIYIILSALGFVGVRKAVSDISTMIK